MLTIQRLAGQRFFRVVFLLPITITPVGIAYMFRMLTDNTSGPFAPIFAGLGMSNFSVLGDPWGARLAVIIGDVWQWIPFMFIVLLAGLEGRDLETEEAGLVDGAGRWQIFRHITLPMIIPVSATVILIRMIEAFKIIDLPNVLTGGGPGTATESVTRREFQELAVVQPWIDRRRSHRSKLIVVTVVATAYARRSTCREPTVREQVTAEDDDEESLRKRTVLDLSPRAKVGAYAIMIAWAIVVLFPLYWLLLTSFKQPVQFTGGTYYLPFVDFQPTLDNWKYILVDVGSDTYRPYINTIVVGFTSAAIALVLGSLAAYGLVRYRYRPRVGVIALGLGCTVLAMIAVVLGAPPIVAVVSAIAVLLILTRAIGNRIAGCASATATSASGSSRCG